MKTRSIPVSKPWLEKEETDYVLSALVDGAISGSYGKYIERFENDFARYCDASYGISTSSSTAALHLALATLGIGPGDEVLVSTFTNMATFFAVLYQGAQPVPVDIEPDTWNINSNLIEEKITKETRAILVVHIYGHPVDMAPVLDLAREHGLYVVEDCAEAHGALYRGQKTGSLGDVGCFSFYANKILTTGEGGMLTTSSTEIAERARALRSLAFGTTSKFMHEDIGFNYRLTNLQAAIGCAQLERIEQIITRKREVAQYYNAHLCDVPGLQLPVEESYARNVYWMYHVLVREEFGSSRQVVMGKLRNRGIETREAFVPYNMQEIILRRGWVKMGDCPVANYVARNGFYLPSGPTLSEEDLEYVVNSLTNIQRGSV